MTDAHEPMRKFFAVRGFDVTEFPWTGKGPAGSIMEGTWTVHPNTKTADGDFDGYVVRKDSMAFLVRTPKDFSNAIKKLGDG
jgi:hypothetical protein